jgi:hypothetical protein
MPRLKATPSAFSNVGNFFPTAVNVWIASANFRVCNWQMPR